MSVLVDRLQFRKDLCEILKSDYVALLGQRGSGSKTLVKLITANESPLPSMKFIAVALPLGEQNSDHFMEIFLNNLINASAQIPPQPGLFNKVRQTVNEEAAFPIISRVRRVLDVFGKTSSPDYLVIVLHALADVSEPPLKDLLLLLREYHNQIGVIKLGGEKLRFLVVGSDRLWNLCCNKPSDSESPFNIAKRVFIEGLSYQEIQSEFQELGIEQAVKLKDLVDGIPSLVELISQETEDFENLSSCFGPLEDSWNSLSFSDREALIEIVRSSQKFPSCQLDNHSPLIAKFEDLTIWHEAFWRGFLKLRHRKLTWRSPVHHAFVMTQAEIEIDMSKSMLLRNSLLERVESLEETLESKMNARILTKCTGELVSLAVHSGNTELVPLLEMMLECKPRNAILEELEKIAVNSSKQWIRDLTKLTIQSQLSFNKLLIETVLGRVAHDIRMQTTILKNMNLSSQHRKQLQEALIEPLVAKPKQDLHEIEGSCSITSKFDVFLAHNSQDKPQVRKIAQELKRRNLNPWLDEEQIPPGRPFQDEIQKAIPLVKSAAIFLGLQGLGRWESWELRALISLCIKNNMSVIPILLPGISSLPEHLLFLEQFRWVEFAQGIDDASALDLLEWGITGRKPETTVEYNKKPGRVPEEQHLEEVETISQPKD